MKAWCPVCRRRLDVEDDRFIRHRISGQPFAEECWGSYKQPVSGPQLRLPIGPDEKEVKDEQGLSV